ncbi:hypothetical protein ACP275_06G154100 [Erythranthe tilingii]
MSYTMIKILLTMFLFLEVNIFQHQFAEGICPSASKRSVHISNGLPPKSAPLKLHCWSKDNDLGYHTLDVKEEFKWSFCANDNLYTCHFWWGSKNRAFEVYKPKVVNTKSVYWVPQSDGIYYLEQTPYSSYFEKKYDWNN